jgi:hypothetical protein
VSLPAWATDVLEADRHIAAVASPDRRNARVSVPVLLSDAEPKLVNGNRRYPWEEWFDGQVHKVTPPTPLRTFHRVAAAAAQRRGLKLWSHTRDGYMLIQARPRADMSDRQKQALIDRQAAEIAKLREALEEIAATSRRHDERFRARQALAGGCQ